MPIMLMRSDDPPALTNGSGMPLVGSSPSTTLMLKNAWNAIIVVNPIAMKAPNRSGARIAVRRPRQVMTQKQATTTVEPISPSSSRDHAEDEVVVRLGQVEQLLDPVHQSAAGDAAGGDGNHRLDHLVAVAERIAVRIEERHAPASSGTRRSR